MESTKNARSILRHKYMPYSEKYAKDAWLNIARSYKKELTPGENQAEIWGNLIKYLHGDENCKYDLARSICILGCTGSGKTMTMNIMSQYMLYDNIAYIRNGVNMSFFYTVYSARDIVSEYLKSGYPGIAKFMIMGNMCIDDIGSEIESPTHYGSKLDVISEVIEQRYNKGLFTHFTSNLNQEQLKERYNDRVYSRIVDQANIVIMNDCDYRL